jgi:hypothetical protein
MFIEEGKDLKNLTYSFKFGYGRRIIQPPQQVDVSNNYCFQGSCIFPAP